MTYEEIQRRDWQDRFNQDVKHAAELFNLLENADDDNRKAIIYSLKDFIAYKLDCMHGEFCNAVVIEEMQVALDEQSDDARREAMRGASE